jgi:GT2 family glycosyltransferase
MMLFQSDGNLGVIKGRNTLYEWRRSMGHNDGRRLIFLDNDQFVLPGWVDAYEEMFDKGYDVVGWEAWQMNHDLFPIQRMRRNVQPFNYVGCGGMMMRPEVPASIGLFDEQFSPAYFEDPDFCFRAHRAGFRIGWSMEINAKIHHEPHSTLGKQDWRKNFNISHEKFKTKWNHEKQNHGWAMPWMKLKEEVVK